MSRGALAEFEADVPRGEPEAHRLDAGPGLTRGDFRHPYLHMGRELEKERR